MGVQVTFSDVFETISDGMSIRRADWLLEYWTRGEGDEVVVSLPCGLTSRLSDAYTEMQLLMHCACDDWVVVSDDTRSRMDALRRVAPSPRQ